MIVSWIGSAGCKSANYKAADLPQALRVPAAPRNAGIKLDRMGGAGVGTSQIGPGDLLDITIVSGSSAEQVKPVPARVAHDGSVAVPLIGSVRISGLEPIAAEQRIAAAAIERGIYRQPHVTLTVTDRAVNRVTVLGAVKEPGVVELPRGSCDLAAALAAAGGLTEEAGTEVQILHRGNPTFLAEQTPAAEALDGVRLASHQEATAPTSVAWAPPSQDAGLPPAGNLALAHRPPAPMTRIDLAAATPATTEDRQLHDRDVVMVMDGQKRVFHVTGLVRKPDQFELTPDTDTRVLDAIAMAGGSTSPLADKVYVIRQLPDMQQPVVIQVSMSDAKRSGEENLRLAAGDLVSVEPTLATMTLDTMNQFFRVGLGLNGSIAGF